ncbi:T9SS type A sorting domain-containing protein [candidate division KSB1 bacterium]|nr:T9SS type A sorting domain-containing protein [candidate division KSB1 bacterium]
MRRFNLVLLLYLAISVMFPINLIANPNSDAFVVNDSTRYCNAPTIALDGTGHFTISWSDEAGVYFQQYDQTGTAIGSNVQANKPEDIYSYSDPAIGMNDQGQFVLAWGYRDFAVIPNIYVRRFDQLGNAQGNPVLVNEESGWIVHGQRSAIDKDGNYVITWHLSDGFKYNVLLQRFNASGNLMRVNEKPYDDTLEPDASEPAIVMKENGGFIIVWSDRRNGVGDIYLQHFSNDGTRQGTNEKVNDDAENKNQNQPAIAMDAGGSFVIAWADARNGYRKDDIYFQRYDSNGNKFGINEKANENIQGTFQQNPFVAMDANGRFVIIWEEYLDGSSVSTRKSPDIIGQRYDNDGSSIGTNSLLVDRDLDANYYIPPKMVANSENIIITWNDNYNIYAKIFSWDWPAQELYTLTTAAMPANGGSITLDPIKDKYAYGESVSIHANANLGYIFDHWDGDVTGNDNPAIITMDGNKNITAYFVNAPTYTLSITILPDYCGHISANPGKFEYIAGEVVTLTAIPDFEEYQFDYWSGDLSGNDNPISITMDGNKNITAHFVQMYRMTVSVEPDDAGSVTIDPEKFLYIWGETVHLTANPNPGYSFDYWSGVDESNLYYSNPFELYVYDFLNVIAHFKSTTDIDLDKSKQTPTEYCLYQNYPNPFNPTTNLRFMLPKPDHVSLKIYNLTGEQIATIVECNYPVGEYNFQWSAEGFANGIYLYRIVTSEFTQTRKLIVQK